MLRQCDFLKQLLVHENTFFSGSVCVCVCVCVCVLCVCVCVRGLKQCWHNYVISECSWVCNFHQSNLYFLSLKCFYFMWYLCWVFYVYLFSRIFKVFNKMKMGTIAIHNKVFTKLYLEIRVGAKEISQYIIF